jgi:hypothetical protein
VRVRSYSVTSPTLVASKFCSTQLAICCDVLLPLSLRMPAPAADEPVHPAVGHVLLEGGCTPSDVPDRRAVMEIKIGG